MKQRKEIISLCEVAIFAAIGFVLDFASNLYSGFFFPSGGSISFAIIAVIILSFRRGPLYGMACGLIVGLLDLTDGFYTVTDTWYKAFLQVGFDYIFTYMFAGIVGVFKPLYKKVNVKILMFFSTLIACLIKFSFHFFSGVLYWPEFPNQPYSERVIYSLIYNGTYMLPTTILSLIIVFIITINYKKIFLFNEEGNA